MSDQINKTHDHAARTALDTWVHALYPGLSGDKRAVIVERAMFQVRQDILGERTNPNLARPPEPPPKLPKGKKQPDPTPTLPVGKFAEAVIQHASDTCAYGQPIDAGVARSAISHGRVTCKNMIPMPGTEADLRDLQLVLNTAEGARFRGVLGAASPEWELLVQQWPQVDAALKLGQASTAMSYAGFARAEPARPAKKAPAAKRPPAKKPPAKPRR